jgi:hypothetical protein
LQFLPDFAAGPTVLVMPVSGVRLESNNPDGDND